MQLKPILIVFALGTIASACEPATSINTSSAEIVNPLDRDSFMMRNPEIRVDLLEQLTLHNIEYWINEDSSIGFYVKDTDEVDRIANEAIGVYISLQ
jgi:hypothetical protein